MKKSYEIKKEDELDHAPSRPRMFQVFHLFKTLSDELEQVMDNCGQPRLKPMIGQRKCGFYQLLVE